MGRSMGPLRAYIFALVLSGTAGAQVSEYTRENSKVWQRQGTQRWAVNERVATIDLAGADFTSWRAAQPSGSILRRLTPLRANRLGFIDVDVPANVDGLAVIAALRADKRVRNAELSAYGSYDAVPNDGFFGTQWHLRNTGQSGGTPGADIGAVGAWDLAVGDPNVVLAVIDSGTQVAHPDLSSNIWANPGEIPANGIDDDGNGFIDDVVGWNFELGSPNVTVTAAHGTNTAGVAIARTNNGIGVAGVAGGFGAVGGCRGMILAVGNSAPQSALIDDAIIYAADNGARVINMSLQVPTTAAINAALVYAHDVRGVAIVAAAGNVSGPINYPANQPQVIAVGSSGRTDARSTFSAFGPQLWLLAPGESITTTSTSSGFASPTGTSFSAPMVSGTICLLFASMPSLAADDARDILRRSAADLGTPGFDNSTGWGRLSASAALTLLAQSDCDDNGIYDPAQIASGFSLDLDVNGVPDECEQLVYCTAQINSLGCLPAISASGSPSASASAGFVVSSSGIRNQRPGVLLYSLNGRASLPIGGGTLCVAGPIRRTPAVNSGGAPSGLDCSGALAIDMNAFARGLLGGSRDPSLSVPGVRVGCQWWSSDPVPGFTGQPNFTNALEYSIAP